MRRNLVRLKFEGLGGFRSVDAQQDGLTLLRLSHPLSSRKFTTSAGVPPIVQTNRPELAH
jgi:hypothetical protein